MATHAIGKFKFNLSDQGLAYRWGDGTVHRLFQGKKKADDDEYVNESETEGNAYQDDYDAPDRDYDYEDGPDSGYADGGYDDDYDDDDRYDDDGDYDDDGRYDDDGDDGYDDGRYDDDGDYDDDYASDSRYDDDDDGYYDDRYQDGDGYDDRYQDADADDAYGDGGAYDDEQSPLMRYVDENDWVTYLLLFLFPPLGIYLLWRRNRFDKPVRWAITAASAIWFVVALILLLRGLFGGAGDTQAQPNITIPPAEVETTAAPADDGAEDIATIDLGGGALTDDTAAEDDTGDAGDAGEATDTADIAAAADGDTEPAPTALAAAGNGASADTASYVWSPASGLYYHSSETCPRIEEGVQVWRVTREIAENSRHQSPCPDCIGGGTTATYYGTVGGKYYHSDSSCSRMRNPLVYTKQAAENEGKTPCPVCILKTMTSLDETDDVGTAFIDKETKDSSGIQVYATKGGTYFHVKSNCSNMQDAVKGSLRDALLAGKKACPTCCPTAGELVYCRSDSKSYHLDKNCQGMKNAKHITLAEAMVMGKTKCDVCVKGSGSTLAGAKETDVSGSSNTKTVNLTASTGDAVKVYATKNGTYYHTKSTCSGMKDAELYTLKSMLLAGKKACPTCASSANTTVYATQGGKYYHSYATCSDMKDAKSGSLAEALAAGYKRCPNCWGKSAAANTATAKNDGTATATANANNAAATTADNANATQATTNATRAQAAASRATASNTYVYATKDGSYYHLNSGCGGMTGASRVTLKTAVNAGKKPCPICAGAASRTVYSTSNGDHYHAASKCAKSGMNNGTKRTLAEALMMNQTACPYCLSSKKAASDAIAAASAAGDAEAQTAQAAASQDSGTYHSGQSGVRVYATLNGKYYHTRSNCPSMNGTPSRVTLETALNYGKKACPECASAATRTVYATKGGKYYHYSKADAGAGAKQGTLAAALAYGFDPCPNCVKRSATATAAQAEGAYENGTSGIKVYATLGSKYYHSNATCSGLTGATRVTLETALNYGKKACPVCLSSANTKVYAVSGDDYYHLSKAHAGSGAIAGTLAEARAAGLKACPLCTKLAAGATSYDNGGTEDAPVSQEDYAAVASTGVYIDIGSANSYYHKAAKCAEAGFSGGSKVTLEYAKDWDYKPCPYCNPPTSVFQDTSDI